MGLYDPDLLVQLVKVALPGFENASHATKGAFRPDVCQSLVGAMI